jgi:hypothetical protein
MSENNRLTNKKQTFNINKIIGNSKHNFNIENKINNYSHNILKTLGIRARILRQMTGLTLDAFCKKYEIEKDLYDKYESGDVIMSNTDIRNLVKKMYLNKEIFCRAEWLEASEKICPIYMSYNTINIKNLKSSELSDSCKVLQMAYGYYSLKKNNLISVVSDSLMGKLYTKGTVVVGEKLDLSDKKILDSLKNVLCIIETKDNKEFVRNITYCNNQIFCCSIDPIRQTFFNFNEIVNVAKVNFALNKNLFNESN